MMKILRRGGNLDDPLDINIDPTSLRSRELRLALEARGEDTKGKRKDLIARLNKILNEEREEAVRQLEMKMERERREKALEEGGSVYFVG